MVQAPFDRSAGKRQEVGDLAHAPLLVVAQPQHDLVLGRQLGQGLGDLRVLGLARHFIGGVSAEGRAAGHHDEVEGRWFLRLAASFARRHATRPVTRDGAQPAREALDPSQLRQLAKGGQERFLRHLLGHVARADDLLGYRGDRAAVAAHQHIECFYVAQQRAKHQLVVANCALLCLSHSCAPST